MTVNSPPRPRLAVRIGVTGHRPGKLAEADMPLLRQQVSQVVARVREIAHDIAADRTNGYSDELPLLRVVSALAEGSDRIVALVARAAGFELQVLLPYSAASYASEFVDSRSRAEFQELLAAATAVYTLDGTPREGEAYERVGYAVLEQSDVLIAIWDGNDAAGRGGTAHIVHRAAEHGIPVVWVGARAPHDTRLLHSDGDELIAADIDGLTSRLTTLLQPPSGHAVADLRERYFAERAVRGRMGRLYGAVTRLVSWTKPLWPRLLPSDYVAATRDAWQRLWTGIPQSVTGPLERALVVPYAWADQLATYYANRHRTAFTWIYALTFFAVVVAFGKEHDVPDHRLYWVVGYVVLLFSLIGLWLIGRRKLWHERWLDYRSLAEQLRHLVILFPIGYGRPVLSVPVHAAAFDPRATWVQWYVRGIASQTGLTTTALDARYLDAYRRLLRAELREQVEYHATLAARSRSVQRRLDRLVLALVFSGLAASVIGFAAAERWDLTPLTVLLPALAGAVYGFLGEGEFRAIARRSEGIQAGLQALVARLDRLRAPSSRSLVRAAETAVDMMGGELIDWRVDVGGKPLKLPKGH